MPTQNDLVELLKRLGVETTEEAGKKIGMLQLACRDRDDANHALGRLQAEYRQILHTIGAADRTAAMRELARLHALDLAAQDAAAAAATVKRSLTVADDEDEPELLRQLDSFQQAYAEDMFPPLSDSERAELAGRGISASMGRHLAKFMGQAAAEIRRLRAAQRSGDAPVVRQIRERGLATWMNCDDIEQFNRLAADERYEVRVLYASPPADARDARIAEDARRYRWLRDTRYNGTIPFGPCERPWACTLLASPTMTIGLDDAIDINIAEDERVRAMRDRTLEGRPNG